MSVDFRIGDFVWMPNQPDTRGRIVDIRDGGVEIWVQPTAANSLSYWTYCENLEPLNALDLIAVNIADPSDNRSG